MPISIYGVLITESKIRNADDMIEVWDSRNICVYWGRKDLRHKEISTLNAYNPNTSDIKPKVNMIKKYFNLSVLKEVATNIPIITDITSGTI